MIYLPIIGALALASATILEKFILRRKKIDAKTFQTAVFFAAVLVMIPLMFFFYRLDALAFQTKNILIFAGVVIASFLANVCLFYAIKWEKISNLEPALILEPLFTVLLAIVFSFFASGLYERDLTVIIPAIIAGFALVFSHIKKHHLDFNKYFLAAIVGSFLFGFELVLSRLILEYYSPLSFYFFRCTFVFLLSFLIFSPKMTKIKPNKIRWLMLITGSLWVFFRVIIYYGYLVLGVISTTLIVMLGPVFVYLFARIFLKEKLDWRNIVASIIIVACVLYVVLA